MFYYNIGSYSKAINAFETTLKNYPEFEKKEQFNYFCFRAYQIKAESSINFKEKKAKYQQAIDYFGGASFGAQQSEAQSEYDECLLAFDNAVSKELKSLYKVVTEEYTTFASDFEYAAAFYQSEKDGLKTDLGKKKATKIYESLMKYSDKYQLTKTK